MAKKKDLTGLIVGNLTVIEEIQQRRRDGKVMWKCQCSCGNITNVVGTLLTHKTRPTQSCGCLQRKRVSEANRQKGMEGQRYGYLTILEWYNGEWKCQCDCGNIINTTTNHLNSGHTQSCGCLQRERTSETTFINLTGKKFGLLTALSLNVELSNSKEKYKQKSGAENA